MVEDGLSKWAQQNRNIYNTNIVLWHTFGILHVTRAEDWPVMPTEYCGFELKPVNFFDSNPAMDVPPVPTHRSFKDGKEKQEFCHNHPPPPSKL